MSDIDMPLTAGDIPSIVVSEILSHLDWNEKLNAVQAISPWKPHLHTSSAWPAIKYGKEYEENVYFAKERRINFRRCIILYGKYMRDISLAFSYNVGRTGLQILHALAEYCSHLQHFEFTPVETIQHDMSFYNDTMWKKSLSVAVCSILQTESLQRVGIMSPYIDWSDTPPENNMVLMIRDSGFSSKISKLELGTNSLIEHDGHLKLLQHFTGLRSLTIRREKINDAILMSLVKNQLMELALYQDEEIPLSDSRQLNHEFWREVLKINPRFKVDMVLRYILVIKDSFVANMPLRSLVLDDLVNIVTKGVMDHLVNNYKNSLESFTYTNSYLENFETGDSRLPAALVSMVTLCQKLNSVQYGFPLSSTSILLVANARKLQKLIIPAVEVSYEFDWPIHETWDTAFVDWLKQNGRSERQMETTVSALLGFDWRLHYENLTLDNERGMYL